jgi:ABC-2 type transport system ATP-binding protein
MSEPATGGPAISARGLIKSFGDVLALDGIDFEAEPGTVLGVLGPNGAGKTTAVRVLTTLLKPDSGEASVAGLDVAEDAPALRAQIGLAGQYAAVDENLTGIENLVMVGRLYGMHRSEARARADELLERFGLSDAGERIVRTYSGGMRRRLDLAAALVAQPPVVFLDEPTTGLDPRSRLELWETIESLVADGTTVLLTTQYLDEADRLADKIVVIDFGRVIAEGTAEDLKERVGGIRVEVHLTDEAAAPAAAEALAPMSAEEPIVEDEKVSVRVESETGRIMEAARRLDSAGIEADDVAIRRPTLEDVFLTLTGRELSAEESGAGSDREELKA